MKCRQTAAAVAVRNGDVGGGCWWMDGHCGASAGDEEEKGKVFIMIIIRAMQWKECISIQRGN